MSEDLLVCALEKSRQIKISVIGRTSGRTITLPLLDDVTVHRAVVDLPSLLFPSVGHRKPARKISVSSRWGTPAPLKKGDSQCEVFDSWPRP